MARKTKSPRVPKSENDACVVSRNAHRVIGIIRYVKNAFMKKKEIKEETIVEMTNEECKEYFGAYDTFCEMEENKIKDENL